MLAARCVAVVWTLVAVCGLERASWELIDKDDAHSDFFSGIGQPADLSAFYMAASAAGDRALGLHGGGCGCASPLRRPGQGHAEDKRNLLRAAFAYFVLDPMNATSVVSVERAVLQLLPYTRHDVVVMTRGAGCDPASTLSKAFAASSRVHVFDVAHSISNAASATLSWTEAPCGSHNRPGVEASTATVTPTDEIVIADPLQLRLALGLPYDRVAVLPVGARLTIGVDDIFHCPETFLFTPSPGPHFHGKFWVAPGRGLGLIRPLLRLLAGDAMFQARYCAHTGRGKCDSLFKPLEKWFGSGEGDAHDGENTTLTQLPGPQKVSVGWLNSCIYAFDGRHDEWLCSQLDVHLRLPRLIVQPSKAIVKLLDMRVSPADYDADPPGPCAPSYFILGVRKGGTTAMHTAICRHPGVQPFKLEGTPNDGELSQNRPGPSDEDRRVYNRRYAQYLPGGVRDFDRVAGESTVRRLANDFNVVPRACGYARTRYVVLLREPLARLHSNLLMRKRFQTADFRPHRNRKATPTVGEVASTHLRAFVRAHQRDPTWLDGPELPRMLFPKTTVNMVYEGIYEAHLRRWLWFVPSTTMRVYLSEDWARDNVAVLRDVLAFIGLDPTSYDWTQGIKQVNARPEEALGANDSIPATLSSEFQRIMEPFNVQLAAFLKAPGPLWQT
mmetsp:Transcript_5712/g.19432  ORF Transcript_5712/g.19432 Transcript_5712/m.19432 type:complete len:670 (+) Transcript_5712:38-2047(+)